MKHLIRNMQFSQKILLVFLVASIVITGASAVVYYDFVSLQLVDNFNVSASDLMNQMNYSLSSQVEGVIGRAKSLLTNRTFMTTLTNYISQPSEKNYAQALGIVGDFLNEMTTSEDLIQTMYVHTPLSGFDDFSHYRSREFDFTTSSFGQAYADPDAQPLQWFPLQRDCIFTRQEWVVPFVWRFGFADYYSDKRQYLVVQIGRGALENVILNNFQSLDYAFVLDNYGNLIVGDEVVFDKVESTLLSLNDSQEEVLEEEILLDGEEYMTMHSDIAVNGWRIVILKNKAELLQNLDNVRNMILRTMFVFLLSSGTIMMWVVRQMTKSLSDLANRMHSVQNGDLTTRFIYPYHDEVGVLANGFNSMLDEIEVLMDKQSQSIEALRQERNRVATMQKQKRKAELSALQAQINPHFLYNTLNAITWQAVSNGDEKTSTISHALGRFFRLSLSKGAEVIPVNEEIEHVRNYLLIQQIRYGDKLQYNFEVDETLLACPIIKLVLQPLVENAIYHGVKYKEGIGVIRVSAQGETDDHGKRWMLFCIEDNGVGIEAQRLSVMNDELRRVISRQSEGYGIFNVNERLHLYYGGDVGLWYESEPGVGTKAFFKVPVLEWEEEEDASDSDCG